jgi:hypothetical protein
LQSSHHTGRDQEKWAGDPRVASVYYGNQLVGKLQQIFTVVFELGVELDDGGRVPPNPHCTFDVENGVNHLQNMPFMKALGDGTFGGRKDKVTYCAYGCRYKKPTHIWHNLSAWSPRPLCTGRCSDHVVANGGQHLEHISGGGGWAAVKFSRIPRLLCSDIAQAAFAHHQEQRTVRIQAIRALS